MQIKKCRKVNHRRCTTQFPFEQNNGKFNNREYIRYLSSESQIQKSKLSKQYVKLSRQFKNILIKNKLNSHCSKYINLNQKNIRNGYEYYNQNKDNSRYQWTKNGFHQMQSIKQKKGLMVGNGRSVDNDNLHSDIMQSLQKVRKSKIYSGTIKKFPTKQTQIHNIKLLSQYNIKNELPLNTQELLLKLQRQKRQKINNDFKNIPQIIAHFHNIYKIRTLIDDYKNNYHIMIRNIKRYVMNYNQAQITKFQNLLKIDKQKDKLKIFLCVQKIVAIGILDSMIRQDEITVKMEGKIILDAIMGVYLSTFSYIMSEEMYNTKKDAKKNKVQNDDQGYDNQKYRQCIEGCLDLLQVEGIQKKKDLESTTQYILKRVKNLFKHNLPLFHKIKQIFTQITKIQINFNSSRVTLSQNIFNKSIQQFSKSSININRFFYHLLCQYARNLNHVDNSKLVKVHKNLLDFFVTCPVPHLVYAPTHKVTIVLQLQGTLAIVKNNLSNFQSMELPHIIQKKTQQANPQPYSFYPSSSKQISIKLRPFIKQFIQQISKISQVIIMTCLMPQNIPTPMTKNGYQSYRDRDRQKQKQLQNLDQVFKMCSALLFRYHFVRYKGVLVKDVSRLGRNMQDVILVQSIDIKNKNSNNINRINQQLVIKDQSYKDTFNNTGNLHTSSAYLYVQNILEISTWKGNTKDQQLIKLKQFFKKILVQKNNQNDVRKILDKYKFTLKNNDDGQDKQIQNSYQEKNNNMIYGQKNSSDIHIQQ